MHDAGDAYVFYTTPVSKKTKYHICTIELNSAQYIKDKNVDNAVVEVPGTSMVRAFCWDLDSFKVIDTKLVTKVVPLSTALKAPHSI